MNLQFQNTIVTIKLIQLHILIIGIEEISINYLDGQHTNKKKIFGWTYRSGKYNRE